MVLFEWVCNSTARIVVPAKQSTVSEAKPSAEDERQRRLEGPTRTNVRGTPIHENSFFNFYKSFLIMLNFYVFGLYATLRKSDNILYC